jgi:Holliday junction DNA helicase RuvA
LIGFLRGRIAAKHPPALTVDVGGVGYEVEAPMSTFYALPGVGSDIVLHTHLVVREDAHVLFGFGTERERALFRELIKVSNVGPRIALAILSGISVDGFHRCVEAEDVSALVRIPGVGRKTAERLVVEMRDRLKTLALGGAAPPATAPGAQSPELTAQSEAFSALVALGYKPPEVMRLLKAVDASVTSTEELIRHALRAAAGA